MVTLPELLFILSFLTFLLLLILISLILIFRRLRKKKSSTAEIETLTDAFKTLGCEINNLREQLQLKDRFAVIGEISAGIAHQIRNPLAVIAGYSKLLLKSLDENDKRCDMIKAILQEVEGINRIIEELFKLSKFEKIEREEINLVALIKKCVENTLRNGKKVIFQEVNDIYIKADQVLLSQAISNLIHNAVDVSDEVKVELKETSLKNKEGVLIDITDKGKGISKSEINKIFSPFYTTKENGIGLGLTIAHKIITAHGGNITVISKENEGSTFTIYLPKD